MNISLKPAERELRRMLVDSRPDVRRAAAGHLDWQESPPVSAFFEHLDHQLADPAIRKLAFNDIKHVVNGILERLRCLVDGKSARVARAALGNLWTIADGLNGCRETVLKAGTHRDAIVREWAVTALKPMLERHSSSDRFLLCRAFDPSTKTRTREEALVCLQMQDRPLDFWREWLLARAALGKARDRAQAIRLLNLVKGDRNGVDSCLLQATRDRHPSVREAALELFKGKSLTPAVLERIEVLLRDGSPSVALAAADALIPDHVKSRVRTVIRRSLRSRDVNLRCRGLQMLERLGKGGRFGYAYARKSLLHSDENVVARAIDALKAMEGLRVSVLRRLAESGKIVGRHAKWVLARMK